MSYNLKCCSFYPNNFDASALTSVGVCMYFGRGTHVPRSGYDDNEAFLRRLSGEKEMTKHVKWRSTTACVVFKDNIFKAFRLRGFLKTIETIFYKNFRIYDGKYLK